MPRKPEPFQSGLGDSMQRLRTPESRSPKNPFKRIIALVKGLNNALALKDHPLVIQATAALQGYQSRGHGRSPRLRALGGGSRTLRDRSKYIPADCFAKGNR